MFHFRYPLASTPSSVMLKLLELAAGASEKQLLQEAPRKEATARKARTVEKSPRPRRAGVLERDLLGRERDCRNEILMVLRLRALMKTTFDSFESTIFLS